jgi:phosphomevalonate kinase
LLPVALEAHAAAQGGAGSGYDVATCCMGGVISWAPESQFSTRISWPDGLHILAAYSGQSASTTAYLRRLSALRRDNPMALDAELQYLNEPVLELETALSHGNVAEILLLLAECQQRLSDWGEGHELGIMTPNISTLVERAKSMGIVAKVSGAGGGDSVIAVSEDLSALERLTTEWTALSYFCFPISLSFLGVHQKLG